MSPIATAASPRRAETGQASVETVALLPLVLVILAVAFQLLIAGRTVWHARVAARAAARAHALGEDGGAAARAHLPAGLERGLRVRESPDGDVRVTVHIPAVIRALDLGHLSATAHFERQDQ
jgi:hypothetical protein